MIRLLRISEDPAIAIVTNQIVSYPRGIDVLTAVFAAACLDFEQQPSASNITNL